MRPATELSRRQKNLVRKVAIDAWDESNFNPDVAEVIVKERLQSVVGSVFVSLAIKLAIELILWWFRNRNQEPSAVFVSGEPGAEEWDDA